MKKELEVVEAAQKKPTKKNESIEKSEEVKKAKKSTKATEKAINSDTSTEVKVEAIVEEQVEKSDVKVVDQVKDTTKAPTKKGKASIFHRFEKKILNNNFGRIVTAKTEFYGKPFKVQMLAKDIVRYNAKYVSEKLRIANTKYCLAVKKLIDSCVANARFFGINDSNLCIRSISVGNGQRPKRYEYKGRGRTGIIRLPRAKVEIKLQEVSVG